MRKLKYLLLTMALAGSALAADNPTIPATPAQEKRPLSAEASARMAEIDASEAQLSLKLQELGQMLQKVIQAQRNEVWITACQAAGWITAKTNECQVDQAGRTITHVPQEAAKIPESKPVK